MKNKKIKIAITLILIVLFIAILMPKSLAGISPSDITGTPVGGSELNIDFVDKVVNVIRLVRNLHSGRRNDGDRYQIYDW